jgi:hypothetical protein
VPANAHGTPGADDRVRGLPLPVIRPDVLHADDARLRPSERTPRLPSREPRTDPVDAAVEVVRCEEGEVAAEISVALDHVVGVRRDVLLVAREDDEFVALRELRAARDRVEIVVGEEVRAEPMSVEPCDEVEVPVVPTSRTTAERVNVKWTTAASRKPSAFGLTVVSSVRSAENGADPFVTRRSSSCGPGEVTSAAAARSAAVTGSCLRLQFPYLPMNKGTIAPLILAA